MHQTTTGQDGDGMATDYFQTQSCRSLSHTYGMSLIGSVTQEYHLDV